MEDKNDYGERFEKGVIVLMVAIIISAFVGVIALQKATHEECTASTDTYCGEPVHH